MHVLKSDQQLYNCLHAKLLKLLYINEVELYSGASKNTAEDL